MNGQLGASTSWWFRAAPPEPLALCRIAITAWATLYAVVRAPDLARSVAADESFRPVGVLRVLGDDPYGSQLGWTLVAATVLFGVAATFGWRYRLSGPTFALLFLWVTTWRNSWGQVFHTENLVTVDLLVLAVAPAADRWTIGRARRGQPSAAYGWPVRLIAVALVITYVLAGVAKLRATGLAWITGDHLRHWVAFDNLRKLELGDRHSPIGAFLVQHRWPWPPIAVLTMAVELGAPLALLGGRCARGWVSAAWCFHTGILLVMAILFPFQLCLVAFLPLLLLGPGGRVELPERVTHRSPRWVPASAA